MNHTNPDFPRPHFIHHESNTVYIYVDSGWPTVMGMPTWIKEDFPGFTGSLCSLSFIESLKRHEQEKSR